MTISKTPGALSAFRRTARGLAHQATFQTPSKTIAPFVEAIISALEPVQGARAILDEVVFEPRSLDALLARHSLQPIDRSDTRAMQDGSIECTGAESLRDLLSALFIDAVQFALIPTPKPFLIYADHDQYTTFFSARQSNLNRVLRPLSQQGFLPNNYSREL